ncbi:hypothetical protein NL64_06455 [Pseudomonas fluorescens]|uniref:gp33 family protein n=1 Tax=Pseudomonas fluorescens TaxID=294 RepID=UPI00054BA6F6|nr:hypothetical protein [Pseudomonas fluorescens]KII34895.1 hypothetical protein NL64_06455 [Pseudomonas fluorescens]
MTTTTKQRLDDLATTRDTLREQKRALEAQVKDIDAALAGNETDIIEIADEMGLDRFAVGKLTFSISSQIVGNVEDWDAVHAYIKKNDAFYLLQRRLSNAPYKEILDSGDSLPGVVPFTKRSLNMRKSA